MTITEVNIRDDISKNNLTSDNNKNILFNKHTIEIGHIFQLGTHYSQIMSTTVQNKDGQNKPLIMGCYGIGITRTIAAIIEQNHDERGIIWPDIIAPFQVAILPMNMYRSHQVQEVANKLYNNLCMHGIEVLMDDRKEHPGVMFADMDLIGIPHNIIISDRNLINNNFEYKYRRNNRRQLIKIDETINFLNETIRVNNN